MGGAKRSSRREDWRWRSLLQAQQSRATGLGRRHSAEGGVQAGQKHHWSPPPPLSAQACTGGGRNGLPGRLLCVGGGGYEASIRKTQSNAPSMQTSALWTNPPSQIGIRGAQGPLPSTSRHGGGRRGDRGGGCFPCQRPRRPAGRAPPLPQHAHAAAPSRNNAPECVRRCPLRNGIGGLARKGHYGGVARDTRCII